MYKRAIITLIAIFIAFAAVLICVIPSSTSVDVLLNTTKYSETGEVLSVSEIRIHGKRLDFLFSADVLQLHIAPFDDLSGFAMESNISTLPESEVVYAFYSASNAATGNVTFFEIGISPDMDKWVLLNETDRVYYVGSDSGEYTAQELVEYFRPLIPGNWIADSTEP